MNKKERSTQAMIDLLEENSDHMINRSANFTFGDSIRNYARQETPEFRKDVMRCWAVGTSGIKGCDWEKIKEHFKSDEEE